MEHGARLSTSRVMAIAFIFMSVLIVLSLSVNVIQGVNNYRLQNEQRTAVTPPHSIHLCFPTNKIMIAQKPTKKNTPKLACLV